MFINEINCLTHQPPHSSLPDTTYRLIRDTYPNRISKRPFRSAGAERLTDVLQHQRIGSGDDLVHGVQDDGEDRLSRDIPDSVFGRGRKDGLFVVTRQRSGLFLRVHDSVRVVREEGRDDLTIC